MPERTVGWTCPQDGERITAETVEDAEAAVRAHFADVDHDNLELVGFGDAGPMLGGVSDG